MRLYEYRVTRHRIAEVEPMIRGPKDAATAIRKVIDGDSLEREELWVIALDTKNRPIGTERVYLGNVAGSSVRVGEVFRMPILTQAAAIIVGHNHPSGDPTPSADDMRITSEFASAGRLLDIELLDHVIVGGDGRFQSIRALGGIA